MRLGGIYNMEPLKNFHWAFLSLGVMRLYHSLVLQPISLLTVVNLNSTICPAISDPFNGPFYRLAANLHQTLFIMLHGKIYCLMGNKFFVPRALESAAAKAREDANANDLTEKNRNQEQQQQLKAD